MEVFKTELVLFAEATKSRYMTTLVLCRSFMVNPIRHDNSLGYTRTPFCRQCPTESQQNSFPLTTIIKHGLDMDAEHYPTPEAVTRPPEASRVPREHVGL